MDLALHNLQWLICLKTNQPNNQQKQWQTQTKQMIECFRQIPLPKPNPSCIGEGKQQKALTSTLIQNRIYFNQEWAISTLSGKPQVDKFIYLCNNISLTESRKAWTAINMLSIIWKFDLSDKVEQDFF